MFYWKRQLLIHDDLRIIPWGIPFSRDDLCLMYSLMSGVTNYDVD